MSAAHSRVLTLVSDPEGQTPSIRLLTLVSDPPGLTPGLAPVPKHSPRGMTPRPARVSDPEGQTPNVRKEAAE